MVAGAIEVVDLEDEVVAVVAEDFGEEEGEEVTITAAVMAADMMKWIMKMVEMATVTVTTIITGISPRATHEVVVVRPGGVAEAVPEAVLIDIEYPGNMFPHFCRSGD